MAHRLAIIGYGGMAGFHHRGIDKHFRGVIEVAGAYDLREEAAQNAAKNGIRAYATPEEIYADDSVDIVLVATPNDFHKAYSIACLRAGKNVVCEKPVALNASELSDITEAALETGKLFTVHQNRRWDRDYRIARKIFEDGVLSGPYTIESRVQGSRQSLHGWRGFKQNGGGMVLDWGVHLIDQMLDWMPDRIVSVSSALHKVISPEVDDNFTATFRFESGVEYVVNVAMNSFIIQPRWQIFATDGTAVIDDWDCNGRIVKLADSKNLVWTENIVYTAAGPTRSMAPRPKETTVELSLPNASPQWTDFYANVAAAIEGREEPIVTHAQAMRVMRLVDLCFESDELRRGVACMV